jgi:hypothetical protein
VSRESIGIENTVSGVKRKKRKRISSHISESDDIGSDSANGIENTVSGVKRKKRNQISSHISESDNVGSDSENGDHIEEDGILSVEEKNLLGSGKEEHFIMIRKVESQPFELGESNTLMERMEQLEKSRKDKESQENNRKDNLKEKLNNLARKELNPLQQIQQPKQKKCLNKKFENEKSVSACKFDVKLF